MNKNEVMKIAHDEYIQLSDKEKETFSKLVNRLMSINYICGERKRDKNDYYFISTNEIVFKNFFDILDYKFYHNKADQVIYIKNENNFNHLNLNQLYSVVLLLLRKIYFQKSQQLQDTEHINTTIGELHAEIEATGLYDKRITKTELRDIYTFLSKYNICEKIGDLNEDESTLIIYPTIKYSNSKVV